MPHHKKQIGIRGKIIHAQGREIIANVLKFMKKEAEKAAPLIPITSYKQRVLEATGISEKTYRQVCKDLELIEAGVIDSFSSPTRGKKPTLIVQSAVETRDMLKEEVVESVEQE